MIRVSIKLNPFVYFIFLQSFDKKLSMPHKNKASCIDEDFTFQKASKRSSYRRIGNKTKIQLVTLYHSKNLKISEIAKRYHLSYATVAHIIKTKPVTSEFIPIKKEELSQVVKEQDFQVKEQISESSIMRNQEMPKQVQRSLPFPLFYPFWPNSFAFPLIQ